MTQKNDRGPDQGLRRPPGVQPLCAPSFHPAGSSTFALPPRSGGSIIEPLLRSDVGGTILAERKLLPARLLLDEYRRAQSLRSITANSKYSIDHAVDLLIPLVGDLAVSQLSGEVIHEIGATLKSEWKKSGTGPYWLNFLLKLLARILREWHETELIARDYGHLLRAFRERETPKRIIADFEQAEIGLISKYLSEPARKFLWAACLTGLRRSNLYPPSFLWGRITQDWVYVVPGVYVKNREELRLPIHPRLQAILEPRMDGQLAVIQGLPHPNAIGRTLKDATRKAGLDPRRMYPHNLRRTCLHWLHEAGVTLDQARDLFGWRSNNVILAHYWRTSDREKWEVIRRL